MDTKIAPWHSQLIPYLFFSAVTKSHLEPPVLMATSRHNTARAQSIQNPLCGSRSTSSELGYTGRMQVPAIAAPQQKSDNSASPHHIRHHIHKDPCAQQHIKFNPNKGNRNLIFTTPVTNTKNELCRLKCLAVKRPLLLVVSLTPLN